MYFKPYARQETVRLTLGQAIVRFLQVQYSEFDGEERRFIPGIWGIFGHGNVSGLSQALVEYGQDLPYHQPRNEQSMVHAASGFAKANFRLATMACTSSIGPGATNMITGAATATINRLPVLLLPSDYYATRFQGQVLQDIEHPISADMSVADCFRVVSRFFDRITRPEQILHSLPEAFRVMTDPAETGAVTIALPQDIQSVAFDYPTNFFHKRVWRIERRKPDEQRIGEAIEMLKQAERPCIVAGGGVHYSQAWAELAEFAEAFGIPVVETFAGRGAVKNGSPMLLYGGGVSGTPIGSKFSGEADVVLLVGTRLADFTTGSNSVFKNPDARFISINVTSHDAYKLGALPIVADAREALRALTAAGWSANHRAQPGYVEEIAVEKQSWEDTLRTQVYADGPSAAIGSAMSQGRLIGLLNETAQPGDTLICAAGTPVGDLQKLWDASNGRGLHLEFGNSCMGYDIPAAIGVRMAQREGEVFVLIGDGNYMLTPMELVTAAVERTKITLILSQNGGFQSIHGHQKALVGHSLGNEFRVRDLKTGLLDNGDFVQVDFAKNAESMGARAWVAHTADEVRNALAEARQETRSCMIVVPTDSSIGLPDSHIWWDVFGAEVTHDPTTEALVLAREAGRKEQRFYY